MTKVESNYQDGQFSALSASAYNAEEVGRRAA